MEIKIITYILLSILLIIAVGCTVSKTGQGGGDCEGGYCCTGPGGAACWGDELGEHV